MDLTLSFGTETAIILLNCLTDSPNSKKIDLNFIYELTPPWFMLEIHNH